MIEPLSDKALKEAVADVWIRRDSLTDKEFWLQLYHSIAQASQIDTVEQIVELLEKWREQGTHLVSNEAIEALKELVKWHRNNSTTT